MTEINNYDNLDSEDREIIYIDLNSVDFETGKIGTVFMGKYTTVLVPTISFIIDQEYSERIENLRIKLVDGQFKLFIE